MAHEDPKRPKPWPSLKTDEDAERFVAEADLSEYDWSIARPAQFTLRQPEGPADSAYDTWLKESVRAAIAEDRAHPYERRSLEEVRVEMDALINTINRKNRKT